ncbi:MAG: DUF1570 domain-containing protein [Planctomycetaceae bacterium]|nr:DUF1570 domain-containing protein [Planctomycetaceae bacterium]
MRFAAWAIALILAGATSSAAAADDLIQERAQLEAKYAEQLAELARQCEAEHDRELAAEIRRWAQPRDPHKLYLAARPEPEIDPDAAEPKPESATAAPRSAEFHKLRKAQGRELYALARRAIRAERASLAFELVIDTLRENPDHADARRLLGYTHFRGAWRTRYEVKKLRAGQVWDARFGWLSPANLARYEKGERLYNGRWIPADEEARIRSDLRRGWTVETEHYSVRTNHSLEAGVALGVRLERLYTAWQQIFVRYYATQAELAQLFDGGGLPRVDDHRHLVVYFRSRDEYRQALAGKIPPDVETSGIYMGAQRTAFFFAPTAARAPRESPGEYSTLYHEAAHQLFSESRQVVPDVGREANFWIVEGIACYFESFEAHPGYYTVGGAEAERLQAARYRALAERFYVPLGELAQFGMVRLQRDPRIGTLYSQAAGLTHFLIHYDSGRYRDALAAYLLAIYTGRSRPDTLAQLTGANFGELDRQYHEFLQALPDPADAPLETAGE